MSVLTMVFALLLVAHDGAEARDQNGDADAPRITVEELKAMLARGEAVTIIDVRGKDYDSSATKIRGAIRIAPAEMAARWNEVPRGRTVVTYCACATDGGAVNAARVLSQNGFSDVRALKGGWNAWNDAGGPVEPK
jgi:rhodanese-related sulfurtransferase